MGPLGPQHAGCSGLDSRGPEAMPREPLARPWQPGQGSTASPLICCLQAAPRTLISRQQANCQPVSTSGASSGRPGGAGPRGPHSLHPFWTALGKRGFFSRAVGSPEEVEGPHMV